MDVQELKSARATLLADLGSFVRFFDIGGIDHENGGFCCGLAHTGERLTGLKFTWFNGRGIWVYSRLYNEGLLSNEPAPRGGASMQDYLLQVATAGRDFLMRNGRDALGQWVVEMDEVGRVIKPAEPLFFPTSGYGSGFAAEGLTAYALATNDVPALELAISILGEMVTLMDDPHREGDRGPWAVTYPGIRTLGHHMVVLNLARQLAETLTTMRQRDGSVVSFPSSFNRGLGVEGTLNELNALLDRMVNAILGPFVHPTYGLLNELLDHEYKRPDDTNEDLCYIGHAIETLWMVMAEAERRGDEQLYAKTARLFRRHVDCAWDPLSGGICRGVYMREWRFIIDRDAKVKWAQDEVIIGCWMLLAHPPVALEDESSDVSLTGGESFVTWAARILRRESAWATEHFDLSKPPWSMPHGSWKVGGDREAKPDPTPGTGISGYNMGCLSLPNRVEHYHHPRMLMRCVRLCDAAIARTSATSISVPPSPPMPADTSAATMVPATSPSAPPAVAQSWEDVESLMYGDEVPNFLLAGQPAAALRWHKFPSAKEVVDALRADPLTKICPGRPPADGGRVRVLDTRDGTSHLRATDESTFEAWFRSAPLDEALAAPFTLAHFQLAKLFSPGGLLDGFDHEVLTPWRAALDAAGFTYERCLPYIFISSGCDVGAFHHDVSHVVAWQIEGVKRFCGYRKPRARHGPELRRMHGQQLTKPPDLSEEEVLAVTMRPGCVLFNQLLTPHWVQSPEDGLAFSINISHGGLQRAGRGLCANEAELVEASLSDPAVMAIRDVTRGWTKTKRPRPD